MGICLTGPHRSSSRPARVPGDADQPTSEEDTLPYWNPTYPDGYGWWNLSGNITVTMQDATTDNPLKEPLDPA